MISQPPGNDSACRAGNGFQMSNNRKSIKPSSKYFQLPTTKPKRYVNCWPEISSITTNCGSLISRRFETRPDAKTPTTATTMTIRISTPLGGEFQFQKLNVLSKFIAARFLLFTSQFRTIHRTVPAMDPHVPGALGK